MKKEQILEVLEKWSYELNGQKLISWNPYDIADAILAIKDSDLITEPMQINDDLLTLAIKTFGNDAQTEMIIEECTELALALMKLKRLRGDMELKYHNVIDEIADVTIMMRQAAKLFPQSRIQDRIDFKMRRLEVRLKR